MAFWSMEAMAKKRRTYSASTKARVAIEALRERQTVAQIASQYETRPNNVSRWKQIAMERLAELFQGPDRRQDDELVTSLYEQIGRLQVELVWMKKNERLLID